MEVNMEKGFLSGKKALAAYFDCGINRVQEFIDAGIPKMYDGKSWVFRVDRVTDWYENYLKNKFPIQQVKPKF